MISPANYDMKKEELLNWAKRKGWNIGDFEKFPSRTENGP